MSRRHPFLLPLLALLLATRALVPTGWMPMVDQSGVHLMLCAGQGPVGGMLGPDGKMHKSMPGHHDPCPYGTLAWAVDTPALPEMVVAPAPQDLPRIEQFAEQRVHSLHAPRPPTRGPPAFA